MNKINPGDKAYTADGILITLDWVLSGKAGAGGKVYDLSTLTVVERALYQSRLVKPIDQMSEEELLASLAILRDDRAEVMKNSGKKITKTRTKTGTEKTSRVKSTKKSTKKPADWKVLEAILSPEEIQNLKTRISAGETISLSDYGL